MTSDRDAVVKSFRQELESASFGIGQVNDSELESWLFGPGPDRLNLLQWCLGQLGHGRERFQNCDEEEAEKRIIEHVKNLGLSHDPNAILGTSGCIDQDQVALWKRMSIFLRAARAQEKTPSKGKNGCSPDLNQIVSSSLRSKDFMDLIHTKVKLLPSELRLVATTIPKRDLDEELKTVILKLEELQELAGDVSSDDEETSKADESIRACEDLKEAFHVNYKKIKECYDHLVGSIFPMVKAQPQNPIANTLGQCIESFVDDVRGFVQMLKSTEDIHRMAAMLQASSLPNGAPIETLELYECIATSHSLVTEVLSLWRLHNML